jgi:hypothetical protein
MKSAKTYVMPEKCPVDGGLMYEYPTGRYCPAEDPHPGGLFVRLDGIVAHRSIISDSTPEKETHESLAPPHNPSHHRPVF